MVRSNRLYVPLICAACCREAPASILHPAQSILDLVIRDLCPACIEHKAEAMSALVHTVNQAGWKALKDEVRRTIRVWDMEEYVTVPVWAKRMSRRQLVIPKETEQPHLDPEDEVILQRLRKKQQELIMPKHQTSRQAKGQTRQSSWLQGLISG